jgi:hypothetical protein
VLKSQANGEGLTAGSLPVHTSGDLDEEERSNYADRA